MFPHTPNPEEPAKIGAIGRIIGVLFSPKETFADIARKPSWIGALVLLTLIGLAVNITLAQRVSWKKVAREQIERVPFAARQFENIPPEQREQALDRQAVIAKVQRYIRGAIGSLFFVFFFGLVYWGAFNLIGGLGTKFLASVGIVAHAAIPLAMRNLIGIPIVLFKDPSQIDPENFVASNVAAFLPSDAPFWQIAVGAGFDLFIFWMYVLLIIGFAQVNPKKVSIGKSLWIVLSVWAFFTLIGVGFAVAIS